METRPARYVPRWMQHPIRTVKLGRVYRYRSFVEKRALASQWFSRERLREWQFSHVRRLLAHAYSTTVYYRELLDDLGVQVRDIRSLSDFSQVVPPLERSTVKERFDDLVSSKWKDHLHLSETSGSTGTPMRFAHPDRFTMQCASRAQLADILQLTGDERTLAIWGSPLGDDRYRDEVPRRNLVQYSFYHLPPEGFDELLDFCVDWRPEVIFGYVSALCAVADALVARGAAPLKVPMVRTHAETLFDWQRDKIARVFGGEVFDHYGSREISDYGVECHAHEGIHLFSNLRLFELEGCREGSPETGEVLVTDFANEAMPFIRYRNGDVLSIDRTPCSCGRSLPRARVLGRTTDMIRLRDGTLICMVFLLRFMDPEQVTRYLVYQRTCDRIDLHIVPTSRFSEHYRDRLVKQLEELTRIHDIRVILEDELDVEIAGKHRMIRSDVCALRGASCCAVRPAGPALCQSWARDSRLPSCRLVCTECSSFSARLPA